MRLPKAIWATFIVVVTVAGLFVGSHIVAFVYGPRWYEPLRPTIPDLLDGRVADQERLAALSATSAVVRGLTIDGATVVAEVTSTGCTEGQNNYKVHSGYRYSCDAQSTTYLAWSGEYLDTAQAIREKLASRCPIPLTKADEIRWQAPRPQTSYSTDVSGGKFRCHSRMIMWISYLNTDGLTSSDSHLSPGYGSDSSRQVSGPSSGELLQSLSEYQWVAVVSPRQIYFEDRP